MRHFRFGPTIAVRGLAPCGELRSALRERLPFGPAPPQEHEIQERCRCRRGTPQGDRQRRERPRRFRSKFNSLSAALSRLALAEGNVYQALVEACQQLRDMNCALDYAERLIALEPDDSEMMMLATTCCSSAATKPASRAPQATPPASSTASRKLVPIINRRSNPLRSGTRVRTRCAPASTPCAETSKSPSATTTPP